MNMKKNGRTLQQDISIIKRGIQEFDKILPGQMAFLTCRSVLSAFTPYIAIVLSAMILNELAGNREEEKLLEYVLFSVGATLLFSVTGFWLDAKIAVGYGRLFSTHELILTDKAYRIPFFRLEQESTRSLREQVSGSISLTGGGMASLYWDMDVVVKNLCSGIIALLLGVKFMSQVAEGVRRGLIRPDIGILILSLLAFLVLGSVFITCKIASKRFDVSFEVFEHGAKYNRYGEFYDLSYLPDEDSAMDIRSFEQKNLILDECQKKCHGVLARGKEKEMKAVGRLQLAQILCTGICGASVYALVGFLAVRKVIGIGNVLMISASSSMLISALSELAQIITDLRNNNVHLLHYFSYMDLEEEVTEKSSRECKKTGNRTIRPGTQKNREQKNAADMVQNTAGRQGIVFDNVSFRYPGSDTMVLQNVSLEIFPGEKMALVGENGSGKTTLVKLLCRLYRPAGGRILLDGKDIWDYPYEEFIAKIATVFQDFSLFAFAIAENVAASGDYDGKKVYAALCSAGIKKKIDSLPRGIRQAISHDYEEDGMDLSGGEAQKTAIARAIYKEAPIVILDEPTAALDPYAEREIQEQFFENLAGETMLSVSHRMSSCRFCDRIAVLHKGKLVQQGTHRELLEQTDGKYAELWEAQAQYYAGEHSPALH